MKWIAISSNWKYTPDKLRTDLFKEVKLIIKNGWGMVAGGALRVDYVATEIMIQYGGVNNIRVAYFFLLH